MSNINGKIPEEGTLALIPMEELMEVYDALPSSIKELYDSMPMPMNPLEFRDMIEAYGEGLGYQMIYNHMKRMFPGWNGGVWKRK